MQNPFVIQQLKAVMSTYHSFRFYTVLLFFFFYREWALKGINPNPIEPVTSIKVVVDAFLQSVATQQENSETSIDLATVRLKVS